MGGCPARRRRESGPICILNNKYCLWGSPAPPSPIYIRVPGTCVVVSRWSGTNPNQWSTNRSHHIPITFDSPEENKQLKCPGGNCSTVLFPRSPATISTNRSPVMRHGSWSCLTGPSPSSSTRASLDQEVRRYD